ncbi:MAG: hypothetical protein IBJ16_14500 [Chitinophagaceae bacterium]|nr:hypothetical protein [Chitinophagaceae bacterium]
MVNIMIQWMLIGLLNVVHPFFMSVIDINHNQKEATLEISVRVFSDDLEKTLQQFSKQKIDILNPAQKESIEKHLQAYVSQRLKLKVNGKPVNFRILGYEQQMESTWCYFEAENQPLINIVDVDCSLLYDYESNQVNIVHMKTKGIQKTYKLDYPKRETSFRF